MKRRRIAGVEVDPEAVLERRAPLRGSEDELRAADRRRTQLELAAAWRERAERLERYAAALRADGQTDAGPEGPQDAEQAAQEWRDAADAIESEAEPFEFSASLPSPQTVAAIGPAAAPAGPVDERGPSLRRGLRSLFLRALRGPGPWRVW